MTVLSPPSRWAHLSRVSHACVHLRSTINLKKQEKRKQKRNERNEKSEGNEKGGEMSEQKNLKDRERYLRKEEVLWRWLRKLRL